MGFTSVFAGGAFVDFFLCILTITLYSCTYMFMCIIHTVRELISRKPPTVYVLATQPKYDRIIVLKFFFSSVLSVNNYYNTYYDYLRFYTRWVTPFSWYKSYSSMRANYFLSVSRSVQIRLPWIVRVIRLKLMYAQTNACTGKRKNFHFE